MNDLRTDDQVADDIRQWLRENGGWILAGLVIGVGALLGWNAWGDYSNAQAEEASVAYEALLSEIIAERPVPAADMAADLAAEYPGSPYVDQARLLLAKLYMDRNEADNAAGYLQQVVNDTKDRNIEELARLRLARVRVQQERYEDALAEVANIDSTSAFAARYHEVAGDIHYAMGDFAEARDAYAAALSADIPGVLNRSFVQAKLDAVSGPAVSNAPVSDAERAEPVAASE